MEPDAFEEALVMLEAGAVDVVGKDWYSRLDKTVTSNLGKYRKYKGNSVRDLLRAMRNKVSRRRLTRPSPWSDGRNTITRTWSRMSSGSSARCRMGSCTTLRRGIPTCSCMFTRLSRTAGYGRRACLRDTSGMSRAPADGKRRGRTESGGTGRLQ
jgi:hypothetical protein